MMMISLVSRATASRRLVTSICLSQSPLTSSFRCSPAFSRSLWKPLSSYCSKRRHPSQVSSDWTNRYYRVVPFVSNARRHFCKNIAKKGNKPQNNTEGIIGWYSRMLEEAPLVTKALTSAVIVLGGDLGCQLLIEGGTLDFARLARMFLIGGALVAPVLHMWYGALFRWFPSPGLKGVLTRVVLDQAIFAPAFCGVFFAAIFGLEGRLDQLEAHLRENFFSAVKVNWLIWIPAQILNFKFVPPQYQVLFANFVALFWNSYLSWSGHKDQHAVEDHTITKEISNSKHD